MNTNQQRTVYAGIGLIVLGIFALTGFWWLLPTLLLAGGGYYIYTNQRSQGRLNEALVGGLWGVGLALTWLTGWWVAGVLLLAGATLLMRGREHQIDAAVQRVLGRAQT